MGLNLLNSSNDPICPTYAAGSMSLMSAIHLPTSSTINDFLNDNVGWGFNPAANNQVIDSTVGATNCGWNNGCLTPSVQPTYSSGLLSFGETGLQS